MEWGYSLAGVFIGFLVGLTGVGGGSLMAPLLILGFGFSPAVAVGTDLWFAAITKTAGGAVHRRLGSPDWQVVKRLALGSIPAAIITVAWLALFQGGRLESDLLLKILGAALLVTAILLPAKGMLRARINWHGGTLSSTLRRRQLTTTILGGAFVGALVTITSVGAGALIAVLLMALYPLRLNTQSVVGTDIIHAIPLALVAALGHSWMGNVDWWLLGQLLIGSVPGIIAGSLVTGRINEKFIRFALAIMLAVSGTKLLMS